MMARPVLVLTALPEEARPLRRALRRYADLVVATTGDGAEGARRATFELLAALRPRMLLLAGLAGALTRGAGPGDSRLIRELRDTTGHARHPSAPLLERARQAGLAEDVLVSTAQLARTPQERDRTRRLAGITAPDTGLVDLESVACAEAADEAGVPWLVVCAVSDGLDDRLPRWLEEARDEDGAMSRAAVATGALLRPVRIPALLGLARRAHVGGRALAQSVSAIVAAVTAAVESETRLPGSSP